MHSRGDFCVVYVYFFSVDFTLDIFIYMASKAVKYFHNPQFCFDYRSKLMWKSRLWWPTWGSSAYAMVSEQLPGKITPALFKVTIHNPFPTWFEHDSHETIIKCCFGVGRHSESSRHWLLFWYTEEIHLVNYWYVSGWSWHIASRSPQGFPAFNMNALSVPM